MRLALVLFALSSLLLALAAPASAASLDPSFGRGGEADVASFPEYGLAEYATDFAADRDRRIYVLEERYSCLGDPCSTTTFVTRLGFDGKRDRTYGTDGRVELALGRDEAREIVVDRQGQPLVISSSGERRLNLLRLREDGTVDTSFGEGGSVALSCKCDWSTEFGVFPAERGRFLVISLLGDEAERGRKLFVTATIHRLDRSGRADRSFGEEGKAIVRVPNASSPGHLISLNGGGFAFTGEGGYHGGGSWVARVGARGNLDRRFLVHSRRSLRQLGGEELGVAELAGRRGNRFDLFGSLGTHGFMARLRPDGRVERAFGRRGLKRLPRPLSAVAFTAPGPILAIGPRVEPDGWFSESGIYTAWLDREGRILQPFVRGGRKLRWTTPWVETGRQGGRFPLIFDPGYGGLEGCRSYCPPHPSLFRFRPL